MKQMLKILRKETKILILTLFIPNVLSTERLLFAIITNPKVAATSKSRSVEMFPRKKMSNTVKLKRSLAESNSYSSP